MAQTRWKKTRKIMLCSKSQGAAPAKGVHDIEKHVLSVQTEGHPKTIVLHLK